MEPVEREEMLKQLPENIKARTSRISAKEAKHVLEYLNERIV